MGQSNKPVKKSEPQKKKSDNPNPGTPRNPKGSRPDTAERNKGNQWWRLRASHGRETIFKTPEILWECCEEYFEATDSRKWNRIDFKGKDNEKVMMPTDTPYALSSLCLFLGVSTTYFNAFEKRIAEKKKVTKKDKDFITVITRARQIIYTQKFEGAAVNAFNSNVIMRELGMYDKTVISGDKENPLQIHQITGMDIL